MKCWESILYSIYNTKIATCDKFSSNANDLSGIQREVEWCRDGLCYAFFYHLVLCVLPDCFATPTGLCSAYADILILSRHSPISYFPL